MADDYKVLAKKIEHLSKRMESVEAAVRSPGRRRSRKTPSGDDSGRLGFCALPSVPERIFPADVSDGRARLIRSIGKKWVNGTRLRYYFFEDAPLKGDDSNVDLVREAFQRWESVGIGLKFQETANIDDAEIRIGFQRGDGAWSYVGRDVIDIPGQHERTMNFGWDLTQDPRGDGLDTPIHEIGHTLGFPHEHQNPFAGIVWNEDEVYRYFMGAPNFWTREQTFFNVLRKLDPREVEGSQWDPDSIMHYSFEGGLIDEPEDYRDGLEPEDGLTESDIAQVKKFYPPLDDRRIRRLNPLELESLSVAAGEQKDFAIKPERSGEFTFQTVGKSDVVMVLFEQIDGECFYMAGDDDSGTNKNATITARLVEDRKYILRVRLFSDWATGKTAVMMS